MTLISIRRIALPRLELRERERERLVGSVILIRRGVVGLRRIVGDVNREDTYVNMNLQVEERGGACRDNLRWERVKVVTVLELEQMLSRLVEVRWMLVR